MGETFMKNLLSNILAFMQNRKINIPEIDETTYWNKLRSDEYYIINSDNIIIVITNRNGKYSNPDANSRSLINKIIGSRKTKVDELIYVCGVRYTNPSDVGKVDKLLQAIDDPAVKIRSYLNFVVNIATSNIVPKHEIITKDELNITLSFLGMKISELGRINAHDSAVVWIGGKTGDIIKIYRPSPGAIMMPNYRIVV